MGPGQRSLGCPRHPLERASGAAAQRSLILVPSSHPPADTDPGQTLWTLGTGSCTGCTCVCTCDPHTGQTHFQLGPSHSAMPADSATDCTSGSSSNTDHRHTPNHTDVQHAHAPGKGALSGAGGQMISLVLILPLMAGDRGAPMAAAGEGSLPVPASWPPTGGAHTPRRPRYPVTWCQDSSAGDCVCNRQ